MVRRRRERKNLTNLGNDIRAACSVCTIHLHAIRLSSKYNKLYIFFISCTSYIRYVIVVRIYQEWGSGGRRSREYSLYISNGYTKYDDVQSEQKPSMSQYSQQKTVSFRTAFLYTLYKSTCLRWKKIVSILCYV